MAQLRAMAQDAVPIIAHLICMCPQCPPPNSNSSKPWWKFDGHWLRTLSVVDNYTPGDSRPTLAKTSNGLRHSICGNKTFPFTQPNLPDFIQRPLQCASICNSQPTLCMTELPSYRTINHTAGNLIVELIVHMKI